MSRGFQLWRLTDTVTSHSTRNYIIYCNLNLLICCVIKDMKATSHKSQMSSYIVLAMLTNSSDPTFDTYCCGLIGGSWHTTVIDVIGPLIQYFMCYWLTRGTIWFMKLVSKRAPYLAEILYQLSCIWHQTKIMSP